MHFLAALLLGWSLGGNDAANCFGTAVSSRMVRWRTAAILVAIAALLGALLEGGGGLRTLGGLSGQDAESALVVTFAASLTIAGMTWASLPASVSQAVVGAILGLAVLRGIAAGDPLGGVPLERLRPVVLCWVGTPIGAALLSMLLYPLLARLVRSARLHFLTYDALMRILLIFGGIYGAYALGANNVANITGPLFAAGVFGGEGEWAERTALLLGGVSIALGALTISRRVMMTVGSDIIPLDAFSAFVVILSEAVTVHLYAKIGVPVSTSQAVVGAVLGIGLLQGLRTVSGRTLAWIAAGWVFTPLLSGAVAALLARIMA